MSEEKQSTMSMYANSEALHKAKSEHYIGKCEGLEQTITQQAKEIVGPKAAYNLLHKAAKEYVTDSYRPEPKYDAVRFDVLSEAVEQSAEQSLAAHDLIKRNEVIEECAVAVGRWSPYSGACCYGHDVAKTIRKLKTGEKQ